jgi:hypothetical protein
MSSDSTDSSPVQWRDYWPTGLSLPQTVQTGFGGPPNLTANGHRGDLSLRARRPGFEVYHSPENVNVKDAWNHTSTPPIWLRGEYRDNSMFLPLTATIKLVTGEQSFCFVIGRYWVPLRLSVQRLGMLRLHDFPSKWWDSGWVSVHDHCRYSQPYQSLTHNNLPVIHYIRHQIKLDVLLTIHQHNETNVMHFAFNLLRIKGLYMFPALLAHPQEAPHKRHLVYCVQFHCNRATAN